jgi:uncharacterized membrane protein
MRQPVSRLKEAFMDKFIAVVIPDEKKAYEVVHELDELHNDGSVTVYATAVVQREPNGTLSVKQGSDEGPVGAALGALLGTFIGLAGGPAGAIAGTAGGALIGGWGQYGHAEVSGQFAEDFARDLRPGDFAVLAEVEEEWVAPIDTRIGQLGGKVVRESREAFAEELLERRVDAEKAAFARVKTGIKTDIKADVATEKAAFERMKANIEDAKAIDKANFERLKTNVATTMAERMESALEHELQSTTDKLRRRAEEAQKRLDQRKEEMDAKVQRLEDQASKANPEVMNRIQQRIAALRQEYGGRLEKLRRAFEMTQEALRA